MLTASHSRSSQLGRELPRLQFQRVHLASSKDLEAVFLDHSGAERALKLCKELLLWDRSEDRYQEIIQCLYKASEKGSCIRVPNNLFEVCPSLSSIASFTECFT